MVLKSKNNIPIYSSAAPGIRIFLKFVNIGKFHCRYLYPDIPDSFSTDIQMKDLN